MPKEAGSRSARGETEEAKRAFPEIASRVCLAEVEWVRDPETKTEQTNGRG